MAYEFTQDGEVLCSTLESFWIYTSFNVEQSTNIVQIQDGYLAVYFSQQSPVKGKTGPALARPKREQAATCEIKGSSGKNSIRLSNLTLLGSRSAEFRNERSYLHVYRFDVNQLPDWFKADWYSNFQITPDNDDQTDFIERTLDFDSVSERQVFWFSYEENFQGISSVTLATPFLGKNIFNDIIQKNNKDMPTLKINSKWHQQNWDFPSNADQVRDSAKQGFVMITEGAFSALPLSAELDSSVDLDSWYFGRSAGGAPIIKRLSELVFTYPTENSHGGLRRYLFNSQRSDASAVIQTTKHPPYEIFHLRGLNDERIGKIVSDKK